MSRPDHDPHDTQGAERFDQAMRMLHAQALEQTSPATRLKLRSARAASANAQRAHRGLRWAGAAVAAVCALAIGINLDTSSLPAPVAEAPSEIAVTSDDSSNYESAVTALDENPDLYVWLASNDDAWLASQ